MHQVRPSPELMPEIATRERESVPTVVRTDLSSLLNDYTNPQQRCMYYY